MSMTQKFFLYLYCENITDMRRFYGEFIGLEERFFALDKAVAYDINGLQFTIFKADSDVCKGEGWARQPGWQGGTSHSTSWSIQLSESEFSAAIQRLSESAGPSFHERPQWKGYWSFPVKDPAGNTVELTFAPSQQPESKSWPLGL